MAEYTVREEGKNGTVAVNNARSVNCLKPLEQTLSQGRIKRLGNNV